MILTENEKKILRLLAVSFNEDFSINDIAKKIFITPNGAYKTLKKFEKENILKVKKISNIKAYKLNFEDEKTARILELAFMPSKLEGRLKLRAQDIQQMKSLTKVCIIFGSYATSKQDPEDLDILFVLDKAKFFIYKKMLEKVQDITPVKIQDVVQTSDDLLQNLKKSDIIVVEALKKGVVLWGSNVIVQVIKDVSR